MTSVTLPFAPSDEVPLADLSTFVLRVVEKKENLHVLWKLMVYFIDDQVEVVVVDG